MGFIDWAIDAGKTGGNSLIGMGLNAIGNLFGGQKKAEERQQKYELEKMDYQYKLNQQAADYSQKKALEMWEKTNYGAQVDQMKMANVNPSLMYSKSGGGGATTSGGQMDGVGMGTSAAVSMGLQWQQIKANTDLMRAEAAKANAEAAKISGADIRNTEADTKVKEKELELKDSVISLNNVTENLRNAETEWKWTDMYRIQASAHEMWQNARKIATDADINEETKRVQIQKTEQEAINSIIAGMEAVSRIKLNETQIKGIENEIRAVWAEIATKEMTAEAAKKNADTAANKLAAEVKKWNKQLDQRDTEILQDWIYNSIDAGCKVSSEVRKWAYVSGH